MPWDRRQAVRPPAGRAGAAIWYTAGRARAREQEDPGSSGKTGGAKGMMYSVMYSGVASGVYDLWDAARDGHNDVIMDSLNSGVDVDDVTTLGKWTALQFAARSAKLESCRLLVEQGATNKQNTAGGNSALHVVGDLACARFLVSCGPDIALQNTANAWLLRGVASASRSSVVSSARTPACSFSGSRCTSRPAPWPRAMTADIVHAIQRSRAADNTRRRRTGRRWRRRSAPAAELRGVSAARNHGGVRQGGDGGAGGQVEAEDLTRGAVQQQDEEQAAKGRPWRRWRG